MSDMSNKLRQHLRKEADEMIFSQMDLSDTLKKKIRQQAAMENTMMREKTGKRRFSLKTWTLGAAGLVAAVMIFVAIPQIQQYTTPAPTENPGESLPPTNGGAIGSEISQLITIPFNSAEEAKAAFGSDLLVPSSIPEGYTLTEIVAVGMEGEPLRDVSFTYSSGEKTITFTASRMPAVFPTDMFTPLQVNDVEGYVFEQPELTELYWVQENIQYSIIAPLSADEALKIAESIAR